MSKQPATQQDVLGRRVAAYKITTGADGEEAKISIERTELHLNHPAGAALVLKRVNALSSVRRCQPLYMLPPCPTELLGRTTELEALTAPLQALHVVDLHGPDGSGKSTLAAAVAHRLDLNHFPDGVLFLTGHVEHQDLLQALFDSFYQSSSPVKITARHVSTYLCNLRALVILDDVGLSPKQIDPVLDALNGSAVLLVNPEWTAVGRGQAVSLKGLPRQEAIALFQKGYPEQSPLVEQLCAVLNDTPLSVASIAALASEGHGSLQKLFNELREHKPWAGPGGDLSIGPALEQMVLTLDETDRQLLSLSAAFGGGHVASETLRNLTQLPSVDFEQRIERLRRLRLLQPVQARSRRTSASCMALPPAYLDAVRHWLVRDEARRAVVNYYVTQLNQDKQLPGTELFNLIGAVQDCAQNGWMDALKLLVRAAERALAQLGWWAEWQHVLDLTRRAAQANGDGVLEAWAVHQLGTLSGALGEFEHAFRRLRTALNMRQAAGDEAGAALSTRNLEALQSLAPAPQVIPPPSPTAAPPPPPPEQAADASTVSTAPARAGWKRRLKLSLMTLLALLVLAAGAFAAWRVWGNGAGDDVAALTVHWEFGDAWNAYDNETWTQQILIVAKGGQGDHTYRVNGEPAGEMFEMTLPLCEGATGLIEVESSDGQTAQVDYAFDSPFCR